MKRIITTAIAMASLVTSTAFARVVLQSRTTAVQATTEASIAENFSVSEDNVKTVVDMPALGIVVKPELLAKTIGADDLLVLAAKDQDTQKAMNNLFLKIDRAAAEYEVSVEDLMKGAVLEMFTGDDASRMEIRVPADSRYDSYFLVTILINAASQHIDIEEDFQDHP